MATARTNRTQQRELTQALRDKHREGVEDDERADEQRDAGEHQQEDVDEVEDGAEVSRLILPELLLRRHVVLRQRRGDAVPYLRLGESFLHPDADRGEGIRLRQQGLCGLPIERGECDPDQVAGGGDADQFDLGSRPVGQ